MQHPTSRRYPKLALSAMLAMCSVAMYSSHAALTDLTTTPLGTSTNGTVVKPNILFILDASGSMHDHYAPDNVDPVSSSGGGVATNASYTCRNDSAGNNNCGSGDPPYRADMFNGLAYNPQTTYKPGVNYDGTTRGSMTAAATTSWTKVPIDAYYAEQGDALSTKNITTSFSHNGWCWTSSCSAPRYNGVHNALLGVNSFAYATPPKPQITGVSITRSGTTVTGTKAGHNVAVNDIIDVSTAVASCNATQAVVTAVTASTFSFTWGDATKMAACGGVSGTVNFSVVGYPEPAAVSLAPTTAVTRSGTTVTVTYPGHRFILGDQVDITGGTTIVYSLTTLVKDTVSPFTKVTVTKTAHGFSVGDVIDVTGGGASCLGTGVTITAILSVDKFTFTSTAAAGGTCSGTYTVTKKFCNTPAAGAAVTGVVAGTSFTITSNGATACGGTYTVSRRAANISTTKNMNPTYYTLSPVEYCSDQHLTDCVGATSAQVGVTVSGRPGNTVNFTYPAYVRYCSSAAAAAAAPIVPTSAPSVAPSGASIICVDKYVKPYIYPRYGLFTRGDIVPTIPPGLPGAGLAMTFPNRPNRSDCVAAPTCSYAEEMTNFANWLAYYQQRMMAMKTSAGLSFIGIDDRYRVGFMVIEPASSSTIEKCTSVPCAPTTEFIPIDVFTPTQKQLFYSAFYAQPGGGGTPLRRALARAGRYFAHKTDSINSGITDDPVQYSCQQNFALLTTDGMWTSSDGVQLDGTTPEGNQDNNLSDPSGMVSRSTGTFDGNCPAGDVKTTGGCSNTLADVAMYYYKTDLRDASLGNATGALGQDVSGNNVPTTDADSANWQHMVTFSLALVDGLMTWQPDYATAQTGDYKNITSGSSGCWWSGSGTCNWPTVTQTTPSALDDLWHAAVNGHGQYFHAGDAQSLVTGLAGALASMSARTAAAAASATSSPNITQLDNVIYSTTYETVDWSGQLIAQYIDTTTGAVLPTIIWSAQAALDATASATSDTRTIYTFDTGASNHLKSFDYAGFSSTEKAWMDNACSPWTKLSQCSTLSGPQQTWINNGSNIVNFVRGQTQNEGTVLRDRKHVLGDTVDATPVYVRAPTYNFADAVTPSYGTFKTAQASRQQVIYLAANDGMLHAFDARVGGSSNGAELWAYVPRMLLSNLYKLADLNYPGKHTYYVDGSPSTMDVYFSGGWHTVLVGGLNNGGRGFYALDITNPLSPQALWEFCSDGALCAISDTDLGYTYGNPVITKLNNGTWVAIVTSGYNNVSPGDGMGHLYVLNIATGTVLYKINTTAGTTGTPSGLGKIAAYADNFQKDNTAKYVYGGDLRGNMWRFDLTGIPGTAPSAQLLGTLTDASNRPQSVTTRPELAYVNSYRVVFVGTGRYLGMSDLTDPATWIPASTDAWQQSLYAFKDTGTNLGNLRTSGNLVQQTINVKDSLTRTSSNNSVDWTSNNGWYVDFNPAGDSPGERVNIDMLLTLGTLNVKTNVPNINACVFGGDSWVYQFRYDTGTYVSTSASQIVAQKITGALTVGFVIVGLPGGGLKDITTTATGEKKTYGVSIGGGAGSGKRIGWREISQ